MVPEDTCRVFGTGFEWRAQASLNTLMKTFKTLFKPCLHQHHLAHPLQTTSQSSLQTSLQTSSSNTSLQPLKQTSNPSLRNLSVAVLATARRSTHSVVRGEEEEEEEYVHGASSYHGSKNSSSNSPNSSRSDSSKQRKEGGRNWNVEGSANGHAFAESRRRSSDRGARQSNNARTS